MTPENQRHGIPLYLGLPTSNKVCPIKSTGVVICVVMMATMTIVNKRVRPRFGKISRKNPIFLRLIVCLSTGRSGNDHGDGEGSCLENDLVIDRQMKRDNKYAATWARTECLERSVHPGLTSRVAILTAVALSSAKQS